MQNHVEDFALIHGDIKDPLIHVYLNKCRVISQPWVTAEACNIRLQFNESWPGQARYTDNLEQNK